MLLTVSRSQLLDLHPAPVLLEGSSSAHLKTGPSMLSRSPVWAGMLQRQVEGDEVAMS